ncbi:hypothetical protein BKG93_06320 [Rodentibacter ratti]|uniref:Carboxyltransferase domain-containing protein n=1 Tax=Rodentibacter ratti TaxID=1906745 RepID=A0A1V3L450_9PAST|nr:biotin-dependent carboxyltransferase family protein [Rodentibacter ratti]OOF84726.1 hypothetical protein BKG93_06320 [Rodentibacter ratti]
MIYIQHLQGFVHLQDLGRFGLRSAGIGHSGAMDNLALQAGNLLLKNAHNLPALEIALGSLSITFDCDTPFCLTGALCEAELDGRSIFPYWRYTAKARQTLKIKGIIQGNYVYLCVAGGFNVPKILGSCSTNLQAGFGGFQGRLLKSGDHLATGKRDTEMSPLGIEPIPFTGKIYATASSEYEAFSPESKKLFWQQRWTLQRNSNRIGYRFSSSQKLTLNSPLEMLSHTVPIGTVQVPPDGQPIVLMADAQTTGGYPKIACVIQADVGRLAQIPFGETVCFELVNHQQARELYQRDQDYLAYVRRKANEVR